MTQAFADVPILGATAPDAGTVMISPTTSRQTTASAMERAMLAIRQRLKIFRKIVQPVAVPVMNMLVPAKRSPQPFLHNESMFSLPDTRVVGDLDVPIPTANEAGTYRTVARIKRSLVPLHVLTLVGTMCFSTVAFAQGGTHLYFPGPPVSAGNTGKFQNLNVGPGSISIVGTGNGGDQITNIANINGQMWANNFPGADIGAKTNNAIAALGRNGGRVHIQTGQYQFSTTIQCPLTTNAPIIIEGDGQANVTSSDPAAFSKGTLLQYLGNGDAVNQVIVSASGTNAGPYQNFSGCQLRDLTIDGSLAGATAIGFHFGGTVQSGTSMVTISFFKNAGIELEDPPYQWTERYVFRDTQVFANTIGLYFHNDLNGQTSFGHGIVRVWTNTLANQTTMKLDGGALLYSSEIVIDGNMNAAPSTMVDVEGSQFIENFFNPRAECMSVSPACTLTNAANNSSIGNDVLLECGGGFTSTVTPGSYIANTVLDAESLGVAHTGTTLFTNENLGVTSLAPRINHGSINSRLNTFTVANGGHTDIVSSCSGMISVTEQGTGGAGDAGLYMCGGGACAYLGSSRNLSWGASTTTPAAGHASVAPDGANYAIYNNEGTSDVYGVTSICSRDSN